VLVLVFVLDPRRAHPPHCTVVPPKYLHDFGP